MSNTKWVKFKNREGPVVHGVHSYSLPDAPIDRDIYVAAAVACENGSYDDVNMYDRGIVSVGLFQWIEANYFNVSSLLGLVCNAGLKDHVMECLDPALRASGAKFVSGPIKWQFILNGKPIEDLEAQKKLFLGCDGLAGSWTPELKGKAVLWAESLAAVWDDPRAREVQRKFANDRIMQYVFKSSRAALFYANAPTTPMANALRAMYVAFAINAPGTADSILVGILRTTKLKEWSDEWCCEILKSLATTKLLPNFAKRYDRARPIVETAYGVKLPTNFNNGVIVQQSIVVTHQNANNIERPHIIQIELQDIIVPVLKQTILQKITNIFKGNK